MHRFFIGSDQLQGAIARINGEDVAHITRVLRLRAGDLVTLCDGAGMDYAARLQSLDKEEILLEVVSSQPSRGEPRHRVTLYQGLPKAGKMELILQKSVELGLYCLVPVLAQRSVVKLTAKEFEKKRIRYQRVAYEAAKQASRCIVNKVRPLASCVDAALARHDLLLIADEEEEAVSLKAVLQSHGDALDIGLVVGPEGGLERSEVAALTAAGGHCLSLGPRILRTETAGMAALAMILYELGDM